MLKCEHLNPTGSFKDRIAAGAIAAGVADGACGWIGSSSGNAGAAFAAYGARAGLPGLVLTVETVVREQFVHMTAFGARVYAVRGFGRDPSVDRLVFEAVRRASVEHRLVLGLTARAYIARAMDGTREIAREIVRELGRAPAAVYVPTGGGGLLASLWQGFRDAVSAGEARTAPRLVAVQTTGCDPVHHALEHGLPTIESRGASTTRISALGLSTPPDGDLALAAVRESGGSSVAVDDEAALAAARTLARRFGVLVEPAAAIAYAAFLAAPRDDAVALMTGSGIKSLAEVGVPGPPVIEAVDIDMLARDLGRSVSDKAAPADGAQESRRPTTGAPDQRGMA
jgi:threonine synthase